MRRSISIFSLTVLLQAFPMMAMAEQTFDPIEQVVAAGLMTKDTNGNFNPERILTRAELASILVKTFRLEQRASTQKPAIAVQDVPNSHWAYNDIQVILKTGIMSGYREGMFYPNQRVSRAEGLAIFAQAYGVFQFPDQNQSEILAKYPDSGTIPGWAQKSLATALYEGFVNVDPTTNRINPLNPMTRADMAYALSQYLERQQNPAPIPEV